MGNKEFTDSIFVSNLGDESKGWIESEIKCPNKCQCTAILTSSKDIHLFQFFGEHTEPGHYSIPLSFILKNVDILNVTQQKREVTPAPTKTF